MKIFHFGILAIYLILSSFPVLSGTEEPKNINIPSEISAFYEDYNFISAYSTTAERRRLIGCMGEAKIPKDLKCQRLENVLARMQKLRQMMLVNDSAMVIWNGRYGTFFGFHFRPVLFVLGDVQLFEEKALVEVRSYELEPDMILRFIGEYDNYAKGNEKNTSFGERLKMANTAEPGLEIHLWCCLNGKWMKSASDLFFLDDES